MAKVKKRRIMEESSSQYRICFMLTFASHGRERGNKMGVVQVVELFTFSSMVVTHPIEDLEGG